MRRILPTVCVALALGVPAGPASAQVVEQDPIEVGAMAPDFELAGATRYGVLEEPVRLSDYRGDAVVLAFFFRARTRG